tara:strand:- start:94 stop:303 length:210 start_codon:yes stop_codon:yes gene_type:complete
MRFINIIKLMCIPLEPEMGGSQLYLAKDKFVEKAQVNRLIEELIIPAIKVCLSKIFIFSLSKEDLLPII